MQKRVVPDETRRRERQRIAAPERIAAGPAAETLFEVINGDAFGRPGVAVGGDHAVAIVIVQQHKLLGQRVMIGRNLSAKNAKAWLAVAFANVAENLIVRAVFLDDVN